MHFPQAVLARGALSGRAVSDAGAAGRAGCVEARRARWTAGHRCLGATAREHRMGRGHLGTAVSRVLRAGERTAPHRGAPGAARGRAGRPHAPAPGLDRRIAESKRAGEPMEPVCLLRRAERLDPGGWGLAGAGPRSARPRVRPGSSATRCTTHSAGPGGCAVAWVSIATGGERMGAGRTLEEAWNNLLGASVPTMPGSAQSDALEEARRWLERADSALRKADWSEFGARLGRTSSLARTALGHHGFVSLLASGPGTSLQRSKTAVLALGGNALARSGEPATITNQFRHARESIAPIVELAREGWRIAIVHGNGPQVGDELVRNESARRTVEPLPLGVLVAGTAGWIGYMLQQSLQNALAAARVEREVVTVITQTLVDRYDPALNRPTKPIGHALSAQGSGAAARGGAIGRPGRRRRMAENGDQPDAARRSWSFRWCSRCSDAGRDRHRRGRRRSAGLRGSAARPRGTGRGSGQGSGRRHPRRAAGGRSADDPDQRGSGVRGLGNAAGAAHPADDGGRRPTR